MIEVFFGFLFLLGETGVLPSDRQVLNWFVSSTAFFSSHRQKFASCFVDYFSLFDSAF